MVRACLVILFVSVLIGAMLPSDPGALLSPAAVAPASPPPDPAPRAMALAQMPGPETILERDPDGHFYADAEINGVPVRFLVDTGASSVALTVEDARRVGLPVVPHEFGVVGRGASGDVRGKLVTLDRVSFGGKSVERVDGAIIEGGDQSLLGQSFLGRFATVEMSGDRMVLR